MSRSANVATGKCRDRQKSDRQKSDRRGVDRHLVDYPNPNVNNLKAFKALEVSALSLLILSVGVFGQKRLFETISG